MIGVGFSINNLKSWTSFRKASELYDFETYSKDLILTTAFLEHGILTKTFTVNTSMRVGDSFLGTKSPEEAWSNMDSFHKRNVFVTAVLNEVMK